MLGKLLLFFAKNTSCITTNKTTTMSNIWKSNYVKVGVITVSAISVIAIVGMTKDALDRYKNIIREGILTSKWGHSLLIGYASVTFGLFIIMTDSVKK
jgi:hypothetical protein